MRDISKIQLTNGEIFNIKDEVARNNINQLKHENVNLLSNTKNNFVFLGDSIQERLWLVEW